MDHQSIFYKFVDKYYHHKVGSDVPCATGHSLVSMCILLEILLLVIISHTLHFFLKRLGQPSAVSQMLAGFLLSPTILGSHNMFVGNQEQLEQLASILRVLFMLLVSLEIDVSCLRHTLRSAALATLGSAIVCVALSIGSGIGLHRLLPSDSSTFLFIIATFLIFFNTATPVVIRALDELKLAMTDIGRLAVSTALVTDLVCVVVISMIDLEVWDMNSSGNYIAARILACAAYILFLSAVSYFMRLGVNALNKRDMHRNEVEDDMVFYLLILIFLVSWYLRRIGLDPILGAFVLGMAMPRDGPTARTMVHHVTFLVQSLVLPVFFGVAGLKFDFGLLSHKEVVVAATLVASLGMAGKIGGTMIGAKFLGIPVLDGLVLSLLLNVKGYIDLVVIYAGQRNRIFSDKAYIALLLSLFINSVIACPVTAAVVRRQREKNGYEFNSLEDLDPEGELRMVACVHTQHDLPTVLDLIEISGAPSRRHLTPCILHLRELAHTATASVVLYHQAQEENGTNADAVQVNYAIDTFIRDTSINVRRGAAASSLGSMHKDLEYAVQEMQASIAVIPLHCKRRFDGKLGTVKAEARELIMNVLRHVPCSVGILVDRGLGQAGRGQAGSGVPPASLSLSLSPESMMVHVVVVFLGGADDREAAAYAARLARHPTVRVTMVRFMGPARDGLGSQQSRTSSRVSEPSNAAVEVDVEEGDDRDEVFIANFYNRFVVNGTVAYVERTVGSSSEFIKMLSSMEQIYSLYIVGRTVQGPAARLTAGMSSWEENPELGSVGDLLASSDFSLNGSVLVIQQYDFTTS